MGLFDKLQNSRSEKLQQEKNAGITFMADNRKKEGITELPNGIQYQILKEADGPKPSPSSKVKAHYRGALLDGKEFDSS
jgi:FKBP-type peptidyl-prolyl cis-trans isomerase FklB